MSEIYLLGEMKKNDSQNNWNQDIIIQLPVKQNTKCSLNTIQALNATSLTEIYIFVNFSWYWSSS